MAQTVIDSAFLLVDQHNQRTYTVGQLIALLDAGSGGGGEGGELTMRASYYTNSVSPDVHYTSTDTDGNILTARTTSGVTSKQGFWIVTQSVVGITEFIAIWDEGDLNDYVSEWIVVAA